MFSFLSSAGNKIVETFEEFGYFDRKGMSNVKAKHNPGLELQLTSEYLKEYDYDSTKSTCINEEIGILYKLTYGEIGARVRCKSNPIAQFSGTWRPGGYLSGLELNSMGTVDINGRKLDKWNVGLNIIVGNISGHMKLEADKYVASTRHRIHRRFVSISEVTTPLIKQALGRSTVVMGFEFDLNSRTTLEVMVSHVHPLSFAILYQSSRPQCLIRLSGDVYSNKTGLSFAFSPFST